MSCFAERETGWMAEAPSFKQYYLRRVLPDMAVCAGVGMIRRTAGMVSVKNITSIADEGKRAHVENVNILYGKDYITTAAVKRAHEAAKQGGRIYPWLKKAL